MSGKRAGQSGNWPKALDRCRKASEKAGWTWTYGGTGHWTVRNPQGDWIMSLSSTLYDGPLVRKYLGKLRRAGCPGAQ